MKRFILTQIVVLTFILSLSAGETGLRVGKAQTPEQAIAELKDIEQSYSGLVAQRLMNPSPVIGGNGPLPVRSPA